MKSKSWIVLLLISLLASNLFWFFQLLDAGLTATYQNASYETMQKDFQQLLILSNKSVVGQSAEDVVRLIGKDVYGSEPFIKDGCLVVSQLCLRLDSNNQVISIDVEEP